MSTGLRERRKHETRLAISDVATALFVERGQGMQKSFAAVACVEFLQGLEFV